MVRCHECFNLEQFCTCNVVAHPFSVQAFEPDFERSLRPQAKPPALRLVRDSEAS